MDLFFTSEQSRIRREAEEFARLVVAASADHIDRTGEFPWDHIRAMANRGWFGLYVPEVYGGHGGDFLSYALVVEEIAASCASTSVILTTQTLAMVPLLIAGTDEQKKRFLAPLAKGETIGAICITEPDAGSDASNITMKGERDGRNYVLNGRKVMITNAGEADVYVVLARTGEHRTKGLTLFVVEKGALGLSFGPRDEYMGIRGSITRDVIFENVIVPEEQRLGEEGDGFRILMRVFNYSRTLVGAQGAGIARGALEYAAKYVKDRVQFGRPLAENEMVQGMLADMAMQVEAARLLVYRAAGMLDRGEPGVALYASMAKCYGSDVAMRVTTDAVQLLGGYGYSKRHPVERMMRDAKVTQIYDGTNQIQRIIVAKEILGQL